MAGSGNAAPVIAIQEPPVHERPSAQQFWRGPLVPFAAGRRASLGKPLMTQADGVSSDLIDWAEAALHNLWSA